MLMKDVQHHVVVIGLLDSTVTIKSAVTHTLVADAAVGPKWTTPHQGGGITTMLGVL